MRKLFELNMNIHFSSQSNEWATPQEFFDELNKEFNFTLDPCATKENAKCDKFYTIEDDGLSKDWRNEIVFCNPPYGRQIKKWVEKAYWTNQTNMVDTPVVMLIPARTDTKYFHDYIYNKAEIRFIRGRLKFGGHINSAPFPSMVVIFK